MTNSVATPKASKAEPQYDVVVGLPSLNEEQGISYVTKVVDEGCQKYFAGKRCLIVNADCKSVDNTQGKFLETQTACDKVYLSTEITAEGKGAGLRLVFEKMVQVGAPMGFCVDTDLETINPQWVQAFATALNQGADMVTPRYMRHRCDGTITNLVTFPLVSALFGKNVRQPIGGDFGFSQRAVRAYLEPNWTNMIKKYGIDIYMTTTVLKKDYKLMEVELPAKVHSPSLPKLVGMVEQVTSAMLVQIKSCESIVRARLDLPTAERPPLVPWVGGGDMSVPEMTVDPEVLAGKAREVFAAHKNVLLAETPKDIIPDLKTAVDTGRLDAKSWAKLLIWGIGKYCAGDAEQQAKIVRVLQLGYLMRAVSHLSFVKDMTNEKAEDVVAEQLNLIIGERGALKDTLPLSQYDVVVGLPSLNEESGISYVTKVVDEGCQKYFPGKKCLIVNADCKSVDNTKGKFLETKTVCDKEYLSTAITAEGKGAGLRLVFERIVQVNASMGFCVDTDLETINPQWVQAFSQALNQGADMVTPRYMRHRCDGTITNLVTFPLVSALFGKNVRQPIGGDFGFSKRAVEAYLEPEWTPMINKYGIDIFMTTSVLKKGYKLMEVELPAKVHSPSLPKLVGMVEQVTSAMLVQIKACEDIIASRLDAPTAETLPLVPWIGGGDMSVPEMTVDPEVLAGKARELFALHKEVLVAETPKHIIPDVEAVVEVGRLDAANWAKLLMWGIGKYCTSDADGQARAVRVLQLGYLMRAVSHLSHVKDMSNEQAEEVVAAQLQLIMGEREELKNSLPRRWLGLLNIFAWCR